MAADRDGFGITISATDIVWVSCGFVNYNEQLCSTDSPFPPFSR